MNAYTWLMAAVLILALLLRGDRPRNKSYIAACFFVMFVVMGMRDITTVGNDSNTIYRRMFLECGALPYSQVGTYFDRESIAYFYFMRLLYDLTGGDYQMAYMLFSIAVLIPLGRFVYKYSPNPVQSIVYYWGLILFGNHFDTMRQGLAMALLLLAFDGIVEEKPLRFLLLTLMGYLFHPPALIFIAAYPLSRLKTNGGYLIFLACLLAFTYHFREQILELMLDFYDTTIYDYDMSFLSNKALIMLVIVLAGLVLRPPEETDRVYGILMQFMGIAIVIQTFASYNNTFERLSNYFFQFSVVFIPMVFQTDSRRSRLLDIKTEAMGKQLAPWVFGAFGVWRFLNTMSNSYGTWLPYRFFFE